MGHSLSKLRRSHHQNLRHLPSRNNPTISSSSSAAPFNGSSTQNVSIPSSSPSSSSSPDVADGTGFAFTAGATRPSTSMMASPPPYVDHRTPKKIKNHINIHKDNVSLFLDHSHLDSHLISFTFDALVDGSITIFYFAKEGPNCNFMPMYPEMYMPKTFPFHKGLAQKFYQPSGTGINLGFFAFNLLSRPSKEEDGIFPLVIYAETCMPTLMGTVDIDQPPPFSIYPHAQITQGALKLNSEGHFEVQVIKQILWIEGIRYELRDIYGFENCNEQGLDDDSETFGTCVICMTEPKDTVVLPCRHMVRLAVINHSYCMCSDCAKQLRLKSKRCPVCRHLIQELIEIKTEIVGIVACTNKENYRTEYSYNVTYTGKAKKAIGLSNWFMKPLLKIYIDRIFSHILATATPCNRLQSPVEYLEYR
ncbi:hypothetical protein GQ457_10G013640 [Hibiscus cannabinus]